MRSSAWAEGVATLQARVQALSTRDRMAVLAGGLALMAGLEFQVAQPLRHKRLQLLQEQGVQLAQSTADKQQLDALTSELAQVRQSLAQRRRPSLSVSSGPNLGTAPRGYLDALRRSLVLEHMQVVSLKALADEEQIDTPTQDAATASPADAAASAPVLYRHRAELRVDGSLNDVEQLVTTLTQEGQVMTAERIHIQGSEQDAGLLEATFTLRTITRERTWLAM